mmetsp:Transcript_105632/g.251870  ORF Transcript_105632/g.251870 Transcript_105632/m.251870 type:complete len:233 (+) Transcript_105632:59-757(+)
MQGSHEARQSVDKCHMSPKLGLGSLSSGPNSVLTDLSRSHHLRHQHRRDLGVPSALRELIGREAALAPALVKAVVHICLVLEEETHHSDVSLLCGLLQSAPLEAPVCGEALHVRIVLQQNFTHLHMPFTSCNREWRPALVTAVIRISSVLQQVLADAGMALPGGHQQRSGAILAQGIHVRLRAKQKLADLAVSKVASFMQGRVPIRALGIQISTLLSDEPQDWYTPAVGRLL